MFIGLTSPESTYDAAYLSNFANLRIRDELLRVPGVGDVLVYGVGEFSMRVWLDPDQLRARKLSASKWWPRSVSKTSRSLRGVSAVLRLPAEPPLSTS